MVKDAFESKQCWEWKGGRKSPDGKYGRIKLTVDGAKTSIGAQRAACIFIWRWTKMRLMCVTSHSV